MFFEMVRWINNGTTGRQGSNGLETKKCTIYVNILPPKSYIKVSKHRTIPIIDFEFENNVKDSLNL